MRFASFVVKVQYAVAACLVDRCLNRPAEGLISKRLHASLLSAEQTLDRFCELKTKASTEFERYRLSTLNSLSTKQAPGTIPIVDNFSPLLSQLEKLSKDSLIVSEQGFIDLCGHCKEEVVDCFDEQYCPPDCLYDDPVPLTMFAVEKARTKCAVSPVYDADYDSKVTQIDELFACLNRDDKVPLSQWIWYEELQLGKNGCSPETWFDALLSIDIVADAFKTGLGTTPVLYTDLVSNANVEQALRKFTCLKGQVNRNLQAVKEAFINAFSWLRVMISETRTIDISNVEGGLSRLDDITTDVIVIRLLRGFSAVVPKLADTIRRSGKTYTLRSTIQVTDKEVWTHVVSGPIAISRYRGRFDPIKLNKVVDVATSFIMYARDRKLDYDAKSELEEA